MNSRFGYMKIVYFLLSLSVTLIVIVLLSSGFGKAPPFGKFLSPQHGFWQNAEPVNKTYTAEMLFSDYSIFLAGSSAVYIQAAVGFLLITLYTRLLPLYNCPIFFLVSGFASISFSMFSAVNTIPNLRFVLSKDNALLPIISLILPAAAYV